MRIWLETIGERNEMEGICNDAFMINNITISISIEKFGQSDVPSLHNIFLA